MAADPSHPSTSSNSAAADEPKLPESFPVGLRVLAVDDDTTCLRIIDRMLRKCHYTVTTCSRAADAMDLLRENRGSFDMVLSDVHMPDMDGFKLLEFAGLEMDLPVIMMSADESKDVVFKGVKHGACDYLIKPVRMENLKNIWQHVVRKNLKDLENSGSVEDGVEKQKKERPDDVDNDSLGNEGNWKNGKRRREGEEEDEFEEREDSSTLKKPRVVWSQELHDQFVTAVKALGIDKAVPKKILEQMNVAGLTRENVASHLQKYRIYLKRVSQQPPGRVDSSFSSITDPSFEQYDLPAFPSSGQLPSQALINLQSMPRRGTNLGMDVAPMSDQTYYHNPDAQLANSSRMHPTVVQQVNNTMIIGNNACMQPRMFGHPQKIVQSYSNMGLHVNEGTQGFINLPQSSIRTSPTYSVGNINGHVSNSVVMQMNQQRQHISLAQQQEQIQFAAQRQAQARGHLVNGINIEHDSRVSTTVGQQILSNGLQTLNLVKNAAAVSPLREPYMNFSPYGSVPEAFYAPHINSKMPSTRASTGFVQEATTTAPNIVHNAAVLRGDSDALPHIDMVEDWNFPNINVQQETIQHGGEQGNIADFCSGVSPHQNFSTNLKDGANWNSCNMRKDIYSTAAKIGHEISDYYSEELLSGADDGFSNSDELILRKQEVSQTNCQYDF